jgi:translation initiation factor 1
MDPFSFAPFDPFQDPFRGGGVSAAGTIQPPVVITRGTIHIRMNKQGNRYITMIEGLDSDLDQKRIAKAMKKAFSCSTSVQKDKEGNDVILLQGDHRMHVKAWLLAQEILTEKEAGERLMLHGY